MKIISLWRPWGAAIMLGYKTIETRTHGRLRNLEGLRIGIHNSKKWDKDARKTMFPYLGPQILDLITNPQHKLNVPGCIIGEVFVYNFRELQISDAEYALCPITTNRYGLLLSKEISYNHPVETRGRQGIWTHHEKIEDPKTEPEVEACPPPE